LHHLGWIDDSIELSFADEAQLKCRRFQREVIIEGVVCDPGGLIVTN